MFFQVVEKYNKIKWKKRTKETPVYHKSQYCGDFVVDILELLNSQAIEKTVEPFVY